MKNQKRYEVRDMRHEKSQGGDVLLSVIVFAAIAVTIVISLVNWGAAMLTGIRTVASKEQAFQIAEAGADYYQWHLAQFPTDYKDGSTTVGTYIHDFFNRDGDLLGMYSLTITPPPTGSTIVKIQSVGKLASSTITRKVVKTLAIPSLAKYAVVANDNMYFGSGTVINGPVQSNKGIRFDGVANNLVSSAVSTYVDPDCSGSTAQCTRWGVYTTSGTDDPQPNTPVNNRPDVFVAGRQFPVPAFDFSGLTSNLSTLLNVATNNGAITCSTSGSAPSCWNASGVFGYYIHLNSNNTFDMYKVNALTSASASCRSDSNSSSFDRWGTWSVQTLSAKIGTYAVPSSGVIFVKDDLWVDGQTNGTRVSIVAAEVIGQTDPAQYSNITINNNLTYTQFDGSDSVGLIAQGDVNVGLMSQDVQTIDAALVAENGRAGRSFYAQSCDATNYKQSTLNLYGMIATSVRYGFSWSCGGTYCSGYDLRNITYDANLLYAPPPSFPQATTQYQVISWQQLQ